MKLENLLTTKEKNKLQETKENVRNKKEKEHNINRDRAIFSSEERKNLSEGNYKIEEQEENKTTIADIKLSSNKTSNNNIDNRETITRAEIMKEAHNKAKEMDNSIDYNERLSTSLQSLHQEYRENKNKKVIQTQSDKENQSIMKQAHNRAKEMDNSINYNKRLSSALKEVHQEKKAREKINKQRKTATHTKEIEGFGVDLKERLKVKDRKDNNNRLDKVKKVEKNVKQKQAKEKLKTERNVKENEINKNAKSKDRLTTSLEELAKFKDKKDNQQRVEKVKEVKENAKQKEKFREFVKNNYDDVITNRQAKKKIRDIQMGREKPKVDEDKRQVINEKDRADKRVNNIQTEKDLSNDRKESLNKTLETIGIKEKTTKRDNQQNKEKTRNAQSYLEEEKRKNIKNISDNIPSDEEVTKNVENVRLNDLDSRIEEVDKHLEKRKERIEELINRIEKNDYKKATFFSHALKANRETAQEELNKVMKEYKLLKRHKNDLYEEKQSIFDYKQYRKEQRNKGFENISQSAKNFRNTGHHRGQAWADKNWERDKGSNIYKPAKKDKEQKQRKEEIEKVENNRKVKKKVGSYNTDKKERVETEQDKHFGVAVDREETRQELKEFFGDTETIEKENERLEKIDKTINNIERDLEDFKEKQEQVAKKLFDPETTPKEEKRLNKKLEEVTKEVQERNERITNLENDKEQIENWQELREEYKEKGISPLHPSENKGEVLNKKRPKTSILVDYLEDATDSSLYAKDKDFLKKHNALSKEEYDKMPVRNENGRENTVEVYAVVEGEREGQDIYKTKHIGTYTKVEMKDIESVRTDVKESSAKVGRDYEIENVRTTSIYAKKGNTRFKI